MICIARTFGAPETVPAGNVSRSSEKASSVVAQPALDVGHQVHDVRVALDLEQARRPHGAGLADAGQVVAGEVDEHHVLGALLLVGGELGRERVVGRRAVAARAGCRRWAAGAAVPSAVSETCVSGDAPTTARPSVSRKNMYGDGLTARSAR